MLDWLGLILSGWGLALQLKENSQSKEAITELHKTLKMVIKRLVLCKNVHAFYQEIQYSNFDSYFLAFDDNSSRINKSNWESNYQTYVVRFKSYDLDVLLRDNIGNSSVSNEKQQLELVEKLGLEKSVEIINTSYPEMISLIWRFDELCKEYNKAVRSRTEFMASKHEDMDQTLKTIIFNADRSMKELIEVLSRIMTSI